MGDGATTNGSVSSSTITVGGVGATLVFANPFTQDFTGTIQGSGTLAKTASGVLTLSGNNSYGGGTILNGGTLNIASDARG